MIIMIRLNFLVHLIKISFSWRSKQCAFTGIIPKARGRERSIVNGHISAKGSQPWIAALGAVMSDDDVEYVCGGSLVSPLHIITSAHCLPALGQHAVVLLGQQDLSLDPIRGGGVERRVIRSVTHPDYVHNSVRPYYDLALLTLNYPVPVSDHIMPVCLPALEFPDIISQRSALPTTRYKSNYRKFNTDDQQLQKSFQLIF